MKSMGQTPPTATYGKHMVMGKEFDSAKPEDYVNSFAIKRT
jgi:nitrate/nitrite transport system substrate-binding protein